jgi:hypothetical protein
LNLLDISNPTTRLELMTAPLETISDQALGLPPADRLSLARTLIESAEDASFEAAWDEEIRERLERFRSGENPGVPAAEVFRRLREIAPGR